MGAYLSQPVTDKVSTPRLGPHVHSWQAHMPAATCVHVALCARHHIPMGKTAIYLQESDEQENTDFKYGVCAMQGWRTEMVSTMMHVVVLGASG